MATSHQTDLRALYRVLNQLVGEMIELRDAVELLEKQVLAKVAPMPSEQVKKPRKKKITQKTSEKDSLECLPEIQVDKSLEVSSSYESH